MGVETFLKKYTHAVAFDLRGWVWNFFKIEARRSRVRPEAERRREPVDNSGIGLPIVHTPVWATELSTGGCGWTGPVMPKGCFAQEARNRTALDLLAE